MQTPHYIAMNENICSRDTMLRFSYQNWLNISLFVVCPTNSDDYISYVTGLMFITKHLMYINIIIIFLLFRLYVQGIHFLFIYVTRTAVDCISGCLRLITIDKFTTCGGNIQRESKRHVK